MKLVELLLLRLAALTKFINFQLSAKTPFCLAPWLYGAPLSALFKKVRPIAVGKFFCRVASHLCYMYFAVWSHLPAVFLTFGQVGVGIFGGVEAHIILFVYL